MSSYKTFSLSDTDLDILRILDSIEGQKPEGLTLAEIHIAEEVNNVEKSNLYRACNKLDDFNLTEKITFKERTDVRYTISQRGKAYLKVAQLISEYKLHEKFVSADKVIKSEYWAGGKLIHSFDNMDKMIEHWRGARPIAYAKNFYRFYREKGTHETVSLGELSDESDIHNIYNH